MVGSVTRGLLNCLLLKRLDYDHKGSIWLTFQVEQNIGLVVLEHLRHEFHVHILNVDFLP